MRVSKFFLAWINHAALNIGAAIACVWYAVVPPQLTGHSKDDIESLCRGGPMKIKEGLLE
jgi:hypothetical protein